MTVVGEIVERTLWSALDSHLRRELDSCHPKQDMTVLKVADGKISVEDSVDVPRAASGRELRDRYVEDVPALTFGLLHMRGSSVRLGPFEMLRFGAAKVTPHAVEWPIEGGLLARASGGTFRIDARSGRLVASVEGYRPRLPLPLYRLTQLPIHHLFMRIHLLRVRGAEPARGVPAPMQNRWRAGMVDLALCVTLTGAISRRPRFRALLGIAAAYHVACWSISGRTLGGIVLRQRVVSVDGSRLRVGQSFVRFLALPFGWIRGRPIQDKASETTVVRDSSLSPQGERAGERGMED